MKYIFILLIVQFLFSGCNRSKSYSVESYKVIRSTFCIKKKCKGVIIPGRMSSLIAPLNGKLKLEITNMDSIYKEKTLIAKVVPIGDELEKNKLNYLNLLRSQSLSRKKLLLKQQLYVKGRLSKNELEQAQIEFDRERLSIQEHKNKLEPYMFFAPFTGQPANIKVGDGSDVLQNDFLMSWIDRNSFFVEMSIPQWHISSIKKGDTVHITGSSLSKTVNGVIYNIESRLFQSDKKNYQSNTEQDYTGQVRFLSRTSDEIFFAGGTVECAVIDTVLPDVITVPISYLHYVNKGVYVNKKRGNQKNLTEVKLGLSDGNMVEVVQGLDAGEEIFIKKINMDFDQ